MLHYCWSQGRIFFQACLEVHQEEGLYWRGLSCPGRGQRTNPAIVARVKSPVASCDVGESVLRRSRTEWTTGHLIGQEEDREDNSWNVASSAAAMVGTVQWKSANMEASYNTRLSPVQHSLNFKQKNIQQMF